MKSPIHDSNENKKMKKTKEETHVDVETDSVLVDENLLYEVLKHVDARTLGMAACVSKQWHRTAQDERLWEVICTKHWVNIGGHKQQLRSAVLALGGFRRLHSLYLWPLFKPSSSSEALPCVSPPAQVFAANSTSNKIRYRNDESGKLKGGMWIFDLLGVISRFLESTFEQLNQLNQKM